MNNGSATKSVCDSEDKSLIILSAATELDLLGIGGPKSPRLYHFICGVTGKADNAEALLELADSL
jgi:hypothetical protein